MLIKSVYCYFSNPLHTLRKLQYIVKIGDNRYWPIIDSLHYIDQSQYSYRSVNDGDSELQILITLHQEPFICDIAMAIYTVTIAS